MTTIAQDLQRVFADLWSQGSCDDSAFVEGFPDVMRQKTQELHPSEFASGEILETGQLRVVFEDGSFVVLDP